MSFPTYEPDLDREILSQSSLSELKSLCSTNNYLKELCESDQLWLLKLQEFEPEVYSHLLTEYGPKETYFGIVDALDRFHKLIEVSLIDLQLDYVETGDDDFRFLARVGARLSKKDGLELEIEIQYRAEQLTLEGEIIYYAKTREIQGNLGIPDSLEPPRSAIYFLSSFFFKHS